MIGTNQHRDQNLGNGRLGVYLDGGADGGANGNTIDANHIVKTTDDAIGISNSDGNLIIENSVGQSWSPEYEKIIFGNSGQGINLLHRSSGNLLEDNVIACSQGNGIVVAQDRGEQTEHNRISRNSIFRNVGRGIYLNGGNENLDAPVVTDLMPRGDEWTIKGETCANCTVEVFSDNVIQGRMFEESVVATERGKFSIIGVPRTNDRFLLTAADVAGNTSELGTSGDFQIFAIEVTQAVQDLDNSVDLIAGQPAFARVQVRSELGPVQATARLRVFQEGRPPRGMHPAGAGCLQEITVQKNPKRSELEHAFCFRLPQRAAHAGEISLTAEVEIISEEIRDTNPADNVFQVGPLEFLDSPPVEVIIFPVGYTERMLPLENLDFSSEADQSDGIRGFAENDLLATGDVDNDGRDELLVLRDLRDLSEAAIGRGPAGKIDIFARNLDEAEIIFKDSMRLDYSFGDRVAVGNVDGGAGNEMLAAHGSDGTVDVWDMAGFIRVLAASFETGFTPGYPFAVGN